MSLLVLARDRSVLPVDLDEAREYCRGPEDGSDDLILTTCVQTAASVVETRTGRILTPGVFQYRMDCWSYEPFWARWIDLPVTPVREIEVLEYVDVDGDLLVVDDESYSLEVGGLLDRLVLGSTFVIPATQTDQPGAVRVTLQAGYDPPGTSGSGDDPRLALPHQAKSAVLMLAEHYYENRGVVSDNPQQTVPMAVGMLMDQIRVFR